MTHSVISKKPFNRHKQDPRKLIPSRKLLSHLLRVIHQGEEQLARLPTSKDSWQVPLQGFCRAKFKTLAIKMNFVVFSCSETNIRENGTGNNNGSILVKYASVLIFMYSYAEVNSICIAMTFCF